MPNFETANSAFSLRITYSLHQDSEAKTSTIRVTRVEIRTNNNTQTAAGYLTGSIRIAGRQGAQMIYNAGMSCPVSLLPTYHGGGEGTWSGFRTQSVTVPHAQDGTLTVRFDVNVEICTTGGTLMTASVRTYREVELPKLIRVSQIEAEPVQVGEVMTIRLNRDQEYCRDTVTWHCGSLSGTVAERTDALELQWTVPMEAAAAAPDAEQAAVTLCVTTWEGETEVGSRETEVVCPIPEEIRPTVQIRLEDPTGTAPRHGGFIQGVSRLRVEATASPGLGAQIVRSSISCGSLTGEESSVTFALDSPGVQSVRAVVWDSRGRSGECTGQIEVIPYSAPNVTIVRVNRCDAQGEDQPDGSYACLVVSADAVEITGSRVEYTAVVTNRKTGEVRQLPLTELDGQWSLRNVRAVIPAGPDSSYDAVVQAADSFRTVRSGSILIPVAFTLLDFDRDRRAVGIGMRARTPGKISVGLDMDLTQLHISNVADPVADGDAVTKGYLLRMLAELRAQIPASSTLGTYPVQQMTAQAAVLEPNVFYLWGEIPSLTLALAAPGDSSRTAEYLFQFTAPAGGAQLQVYGVRWNYFPPAFEEGKTYQVSILNGIGGIVSA